MTIWISWGYEIYKKYYKFLKLASFYITRMTRYLERKL